MSTLSQLIVRTADRLSMVAGTGVQTYAEDRIAEMIQHKFDVLFDEVFWPQFLSWNKLTLDGTLGIVTVDLSNAIKRFEDIRVIFPENSNTPLTTISGLTTNPYELVVQHLFIMKLLVLIMLTKQQEFLMYGLKLLLEISYYNIEQSQIHL